MKTNMDYETLRNSMSVQDAARVLKETNCYGTMDIAKNVILKALDEQMSSSEKPNKWINKSQESDNENCDDIWEKAYKEREGKKMNDSFELTLNNPLTKEDWDIIADVELENTPSITFKTPKGKQVKYIKSDILDKIRKEIKALSPEPTAYDVVDGNPVKDAIWETLNDVLQIIDKYTAESEE